MAPELILPLFRADHEEAARGVVAQGDDAIDRCALGKAMARGDGRAPPRTTMRWVMVAPGASATTAPRADTGSTFAHKVITAA